MSEQINIWSDFVGTPETVDVFLEKENVSTSATVTALNSYETAIQGGNFTQAETIKTENGLDKYLINAEDINKIAGGINAVQELFAGDVKSNLAELCENKGVWANNTEYHKLNLVTYSPDATGLFMYLCIEPHTSSTTITPANESYWTRLSTIAQSNGYPLMGEWSSTTTYNQDDIVKKNSKLFRSLVNSNVGNTPENVTFKNYWSKVTYSGWSPTTSYSSGNNVTFNQEDGVYVYKSLVDSNSGILPLNYQYCTKIEEWDSSATTYGAGTIVHLNNYGYYLRTSSQSSNESPDGDSGLGAYWAKIGIDSDVVDWSEAYVYQNSVIQNDSTLSVKLFRYNSNVYYTSSNVETKIPNESQRTGLIPYVSGKASTNWSLVQKLEEYDSSFSYSTNALVLYTEFMYKSLENNNLNNVPGVAVVVESSDTTHWELVYYVQDSTQSTSGLLSKTDKMKLDDIEEQANHIVLADDLITNDSTKALTANQGMILNNNINNISTSITNQLVPTAVSIKISNTTLCDEIINASCYLPACKLVVINIRMRRKSNATTTRGTGYCLAQVLDTSLLPIRTTALTQCSSSDTGSPMANIDADGSINMRITVATNPSYFYISGVYVPAKDLPTAFTESVKYPL